MERDVKCFVIMPFSQTTPEHTADYWTALFDNYLAPILLEHPRIEVFRSAARREDLLSEIIKNLVVQPIVVADLTDHNPNVFWELGVRQSFQHKTITIAAHGTKIPFDLGKKGTLFYYPNDAIRSETFRNELKFAIQDCIEHPTRPDSIVLESIGGRGSLFEIIRQDEVQRRIIALRSEFRFNHQGLTHVLAQVKSNIAIRKVKAQAKKTKKTESFVTMRFRYSAVELAVTNRYLDVDQIFYDTAEEYYDGLLRLNDQLQLWEQSQVSVEDYLQKTGYLFKQDFENFKVNLDKLDLK